MDLGLIFVALAVLACPAMMYFMMRGGSHASSHGEGAAPGEGDKDQEIRALKARLEELESRVSSEGRSR